jgi:hypothetical protein
MQCSWVHTEKGAESVRILTRTCELGHGPAANAGAAAEESKVWVHSRTPASFIGGEALSFVGSNGGLPWHRSVA